MNTFLRRGNIVYFICLGQQIHIDRTLRARNCANYWIYSFYMMELSEPEVKNWQKQTSAMVW